MNLYDLLTENVDDLLIKGKSPLVVKNIKRLKKMIFKGWKVLEIARGGKYFQNGMKQNRYISYHLYGDRYERIAEKETGMTEGDEFEASLLAQHRKRYEDEEEEDFVDAFKKEFSEYRKPNIILMHDDKRILSRAIQALLLLGARKDITLAIYVPNPDDFPFSYLR